MMQKNQLVKDVVMLLSPKEVCYWDCKKPTKSINEMRSILTTGNLKALIETSFDGQLWTKIQESKQKGHKDLWNFLEQKKVDLGRVVVLKYQRNGDPVRDGRTLFRVLLEDVINGHKLVTLMLNRLVEAKPAIEDSEELPCPECSDTDKQEANIKLDLKPIYSNGDQMKLVSDLLDIQSQRGSGGNLSEIFEHPIIQTLILSKWERLSFSFIVRVRLFAVFVFLFTAFMRVKIVEFRLLPNKNNITGLLNDTWVGWMSQTCKTKVGDENTQLDPSIFHSNTPQGTKRNVFIVSTILGVVLLWQLLLFLWRVCEILRICRDKRKEKTKNDDDQTVTKYSYRRKMNDMFIRLVNIFCLVLFIFSCTNTCRLVVVLLCLWFYFVVRELMQFGVLVWSPVWHGQGTWKDFLIQLFKMNYWNDPENYIEIACYITVPISIFCKVTGNDPTAEILRGIVAGGICCSWIELIFNLGIPSRTFLGDFITMFYNVVKIKLWSYMQIFFLLTSGFGFAFWILNEGHMGHTRNVDQGKEVEEEVTFNGFWISTLLSITMSIGELNISDFYLHFDAIPKTQIFAMLFLVMLIILSTIAMINLLIAAIISDYKEMKKEVDNQSMVFMTEYIIQVETYMRLMQKTPFYFYGKWVQKKTKLADILEYCPHEMCNNQQRRYEQNCKKVPLPLIRANKKTINPSEEAGERKAILERLIALRNRLQNTKKQGELCEYHKYHKSLQQE